MSELHCRTGTHRSMGGKELPTPLLVVLAVNGAGEPLAYICPLCQTHHTLDGQPGGRAADIVHLSSSGEFARSAARLMARDQQPLTEAE